MTDTSFEELTLAELRRFENNLEGAAKTLQRQRPKGFTRAQAHAIFDKSRAEAVQAYEGALDELIAAIGAMPGPYYTLNLPRRHAAVAALHVLASDQFAEAVHARIDAVPLGRGIDYENADDQGAAIDRNNAELARKEREAKQVGEIIKRARRRSASASSMRSANAPRRGGRRTSGKARHTSGACSASRRKGNGDWNGYWKRRSHENTQRLARGADAARELGGDDGGAARLLGHGP